MIIFGVQNHKVYMKHKMRKTISAANVSMRAALPPVSHKNEKEGQKKRLGFGYETSFCSF